MHALKMTVTVANHRFQAELPAEVPDGATELIVLYSGVEKPAPERASFQAFNQWLRQQPASGRSRSDIDEQIREERATWD